MGLFDFLEPEWKKSPEAVLEHIGYWTGSTDIIRMMEQVKFPEDDMISIRFTSLERLYILKRRGRPEAGMYLSDLAKNGKTALVRCQAKEYCYEHEQTSWSIYDDEKELKEVEKELEKIKDPNLWLKLAMADFSAAPIIAKKLPNDLLAKALCSDNSDVRKYAAEHLDLNRLSVSQKRDLLPSAMRDHPGALLITEKLPNDLLAKVLLSDNSDVRKYAAEHLDLNSLTESQKRDLLKFAMLDRPEALIIAGKLPNDLLATVLSSDHAEVRKYAAEHVDLNRLTESQKEDLLAKALNSDYSDVREYAAEHVDLNSLTESQKEDLLKSAMRDLPEAPIIARKLPNDLLAKVLYSEHADVRKYAAEHLDFNGLSKSQKDAFINDLVHTLDPKKKYGVNIIFDALKDLYKKQPGIYPYLSELNGKEFTFKHCVVSGWCDWRSCKDTVTLEIGLSNKGGLKIDSIWGR